MFSKASEYGIRAVLYICSESNGGKKTTINEIYEHVEAPRHFTAKVLQKLSRAKLISSTKGVNGGFYLTSEQSKNSLFQIVNAIDGDALFTECGLGLKYCSATEPCPLHDQFMSIRTNLKKMMTGTSIQNMAVKIKSGKILT